MHITNRPHVSSADLFCSKVFCAGAVFPLACVLPLCVSLSLECITCPGEKKDYILSREDRSSVVWKQVVFSPRVVFKDVICVWANREKHVKGIDPRRGGGGLQESKRRLSHLPSNLTFWSLFLPSSLSSSLIRPRSWLQPAVQLFFLSLGVFVAAVAAFHSASGKWKVVQTFRLPIWEDLSSKAR